MNIITDIFGLYEDKLSTGNMAARGVLVFIFSLLVIRISGIRTLGRQTSFDQLTAFILGSLLGRIIIEGGNFFGTLVAVLVIVVCHRLVSWITFRSHRAGRWLKGDPLLLIDDGQTIVPNLKKGCITEDDLKESLHKVLNTSKWDKVDKVYLERSGEMTFIKAENK